MPRQISNFLFIAFVFALPGCSYQCHFEARGGVREAASGQPITSARVELLNAEARQLADPVVTNQQGEFQVSFTTVPSAGGELTGWKVVVSAEGYEPETIAVGPVKRPKRDDVTVYLIIHVAMRRSE